MTLGAICSPLGNRKALCSVSCYLSLQHERWGRGLYPELLCATKPKLAVGKRNRMCWAPSRALEVGADSSPSLGQVPHHLWEVLCFELSPPWAGACGSLGVSIWHEEAGAPPQPAWSAGGGHI